MANVTPQPALAATTLEREPAIERKLARAWRKERTITHGRGLATVVTALMAGWAALLAIDWLLLLPGSVRLVLLLAGIAGMAWIAYRYWWTHIRPFDRLRTALRVERKHPELSSLLVSYVELESPADSHSPTLVAALRREAVTLSEPLPFTDIVETATLKRVALWAIAGAVAMTTLAIVFPGVMSTFLVRMANPFATVSYPTRTRIDSLTGNLTVAAGSTLRINATTSGVTPPEGVIFLRTGTGDWDEGRLVPGDSADTFSYEIASALDGFQYYVRLGDATSATHDVTVVPAPAPARIEVTVTPPEYTGQDPRVIDSLNFQALRGSKVTWAFTFDRPLLAAQMVPTEDGSAVDVSLSDDGLRATVARAADDSLTYRLRWTEREHGFVFDDGVQYRMQVVPDQPPMVSLTSPRDDAPGTLRKAFDVVFTASDDYGLRDAAIAYQINDGDEVRKPLQSLSGATAERRFTWKPADDIPQLREGDVLSWSIVGNDNGRDAEGNANTGRSPSRRLFVMSEPEYLAWIAERKGEMFEALQDVRGNQVDASDEIQTLRTLTGEPATPTGESKP